MTQDAGKIETLLTEAHQATRSQRRRLAEVRAREHVGAAGWAQTSVLDSILKAGQEGLVATDSLRQVVWLTTEHIRALPLLAMSEQGQGHQAALADIVRSGQDQISAAAVLDEVICKALDEVAATPVDEVNVQRLKRIQRRVQAQVESLETLIEAAKAQADTLEQVTALEQISAEHQRRVGNLRQIDAEEQVNTLGAAGQEIVEQIAQIDEAHPQQLTALQGIGEAIVEKLPATGAHPQDQADTLEKIAQSALDKAEELRDEGSGTQ